MGATADNYLRVIDERNGDVLWQARLPVGGQATPMSYATGVRQDRGAHHGMQIDVGA